MSNGRGSLGGKVVKAVLLSAVLGFAWACWDTGTNPLKLIQKLTGGTEPEAPAPSPAVRRPEAAPRPPRTESPGTDAVAVKPPPAPAPAPAGPRAYSAVELGGIFNAVEDHLRRGRIFEAREKIKSASKLMVPPDQLGKFNEVEGRVERYYGLVLETTKGTTIDMPQLYQIFPKTGGKLVVKILKEEPDAVYFETITSIRSKLPRDQIQSLGRLSPPQARAELRAELKSAAGYKGLDVVWEPGQPLVYKERGGKTVTGLQFFDLADFCAKTGLNDELIPLFDEALKRDPGLHTTVHEVKADRMVNVFLYFLSINAAADAGLTLKILNDRYADTRAYRERVASDPDVKTATDLVLRRSEPLARVAPAPPPTPAPAPDPTDPAPKTPEPVPPPAPTPQPPPSASSGEPSGLPLPDGTPPRVRDLVARGDRHFDEAMKHLRDSDPNINPEGWTVENKKAMELFARANNEGYVPAQDAYEVPGAIPQSILDRVRETTMRQSLCRKRSVSTRK